MTAFICYLLGICYCSDSIESTQNAQQNRSEIKITEGEKSSKSDNQFKCSYMSTTNYFSSPQNHSDLNNPFGKMCDSSSTKSVRSNPYSISKDQKRVQKQKPEDDKILELEKLAENLHIHNDDNNKVNTDSNKTFENMCLSEQRNNDNSSSINEEDEIAMEE